MEELTPIGDADERYLEEIARDCEVRLGQGAELVSLSREADAQRVRLRLRYRIGDREHESEGSGASLFEAHRALCDRIVVDRVRFGFTDLVTPA
jgi:hypothetical protein